MLTRRKALNHVACSPAACLLHAITVCESWAGNSVDLVVACDCVYPDPDGPSPDAAHFVAALAALCAPPGAQGCCKPGAAVVRRGVWHAEQPRAPRGTGACAEARPAAAAPVAQSAELGTSPGAAGDCRTPGGCAPPVSRAGTEGSEAASEPLSDGTALQCSASSLRADAHGAIASGRALVTFEARSDEMRGAFLQAAQTRFGCVRRLSTEELPLLYRVEHVEVYELASCKHCRA